MEMPWKHLPFIVTKFIAEAKQKPRSSWSPLQKSSWAENYGVIFTLYQHHDDKKYHVNQEYIGRNFSQPSVPWEEKGVSLSLSPADLVRSLPQGCVPVLAHGPRHCRLAAVWWRPLPEHLLVHPWSLLCYLGELTHASKL